jgi:hypothetical protein
MYGGVAVSGAVDLIGYYTPLPAGTEQVRRAARSAQDFSVVGMSTPARPPP